MNIFLMLEFYQSQQPNFPTNFCDHLKYKTNKIEIKLSKIKSTSRVLKNILGKS